MSGKFFTTQVFINEDKGVVQIGRCAKIYNSYVSHQLWDELLHVGMSLMALPPTKSVITIHRSTWDAILLWADDYTELMPLHTYLNKMFARSLTD